MNINETYIFVMKFKVPWSVLPETVVKLVTPFYQLSIFYEDHNQECLMTK